MSASRLAHQVGTTACALFLTARIVPAALTGTYVDARPADLSGGNTVRTSDSAPGGWYKQGPWPPDAGKWLFQDGVAGLNTNGIPGTGNDFFTFQSAAANTAPGVTTTGSGLNALGLYDVYVVYKAASWVPGQYGVVVGMSGSAPTNYYTDLNGTDVDITAGIPVYQAKIGSSIEAVGGQLAVNAERPVISSHQGWYEGFSYVQVGTATTTLGTSTTSTTTTSTTSTTTILTTSTTSTSSTTAGMVGTYVDARPADLSNGNTVRTSDGATGGWYELGPWNPQPGKWMLQTDNNPGGLNINGVPGGGADFWSMQHAHAGSVPQLTTTLSGLNALGLYDLYVVYETASWELGYGIKVSLPGGSTTNVFDGNNGTDTGLVLPGGLSVYQGKIASETATDAGQLETLLESIFSGGADRTYYEGLSYEQVGIRAQGMTVIVK